VNIITKSRLVLRDLDLLRELAAFSAVSVAISITTLDPALARAMEPRASAPAARLETIRRMRDAGIPVMVMVAPVIPGLTDREMPKILEAAAAAGAMKAGWVLLRLPFQVKALFTDWLARWFPDRAGHVESLLRQMRDGQLYDPAWGARQRGQGALAAQLGNTFDVFARRAGLAGPMPPLSAAAFIRPQTGGQLPLFP
jgi:DNA repair photolyase